MNQFRYVASVLLLAGTFLPTAHAEEAWIAESNANTRVVMESQARFRPEGFANEGLEQFDSEIRDLNPGIYERVRTANLELVALMKKKLETAEDPRVAQDLNILIKSLEDSLQSAALDRQYMLPYYNVAQSLFYGYRGLLDPRVDAERYPAALVRLNKYTGEEPGYTPITELAKQRTLERVPETALIGPYVGELQKDIDNTQRFKAGLRQAFVESGLEGWEDSLAILETQLDDYAEWLREEMLPRARDSHRLPDPIYADNLKRYGVDADPRELLEQALFGFGEIRNEMQVLARLIAAERNLPSEDYRDVIRELKKDQIPADEILDVYRERLAMLEEIIRREGIVTLPEREAVIRLGTDAESAAVPAPFLSPPQLIGNTGQSAEFVLVTRNPTLEEGEAIDDFGHDSATWSLTVHEARPGHELQFASMLETGVSTARVFYAFNSANVEGWGLYAEAIMKEHLPLEGQLLSLQALLARAARAFLDPMLNLGMIEPDRALDFLMTEVALSKALASSEIDRYTFRAPGQATSYYYGYMKMVGLRTEVELLLGEKFDQKAFHDFVLAQGLLPPDLLRKAVLDDFVPTQ
jgi:hypothetical protein